MNSINNGWDSTKQAETPYFHYGPSGQNENERKGYSKQNKKNKKNMGMNKSKENTLIYMHVYICTHLWTYKHIQIQIHIFT